LEQDYGGKERKNGKKGPEKNEVDVHGRPLWVDDRRRWIGAPVKTAAMFLIATGSGL
jgi:hypothetical protein